MAVRGTRLELDGRDFLVSGWNLWQAAEWGADVTPNPPRTYLSAGRSGRESLAEILDDGMSAGFNMVRIFAHGVLPGYQMQTSPGVYEERLFRGLDYAVAEAGRRGLKIVLSLVDNWSPVDSVNSYVGWCAGRGAAHAEFYTNERCRQLYKNHGE